MIKPQSEQTLSCLPTHQITMYYVCTTCGTRTDPPKNGKFVWCDKCGKWKPAKLGKE